MRRILFAFLIGATVLASGCAKINPRQDQKIDNQNGKIDEIRSNQNGLMLELGKLKQDATIHDSQLKEVQQGMLNLNAAVSRNENSGVQILQGDGPLILVFGLGVVGLLLYHFRNRAVQAEKAAEILASEVARSGDAVLENNVLRAVLHTEVEGTVYRMLVKHKK